MYLLSEELKRFKEEKKKKDFTDLIVDYIARDTKTNFEVLFIDEAQDLSSLQWDMKIYVERHRQNIHSR